jgi:hypothetical protein
MKFSATKLFSVFLILFLTLSSSVYSQYRKGYIIDNKNDTASGYIDFEGSLSNSEHCKFISMPDSTEHIYYPGGIKAFRFIDSKYFTSSEIPVNGETKKVFLEWLIKGRASILTYTTAKMKSRYFIKLENDSLYELINTTSIISRVNPKDAVSKYETTYEHERKEYVGALLNYFKDCPSISHDIENTSLSSKPLIKIAKEYHERTCKTEDCIIFEDTHRAQGFEIGVSVSQLFSQFRANNGIPEKAPLTGSPGIGISVNISNLPLVSSKFSFITGVSFYSLTFRYDSSSYLYTDNKIGTLKYFRIPWQLNYKFSYNKFSPYIALGVTTNMRFDFRSYNPYLVNMVTKTYNYKDGLANFQIGLDAGLGFRYSISPKTSVSIKFDYEHAFRFFGKFNADKSYNNNGVIEASFFYKLK